MKPGAPVVVRAATDRGAARFVDARLEETHAHATDATASVSARGSSTFRLHLLLPADPPPDPLNSPSTTRCAQAGLVEQSLASDPWRVLEAEPQPSASTSASSSKEAGSGGQGSQGGKQGGDERDGASAGGLSVSAASAPPRYICCAVVSSLLCLPITVMWCVGVWVCVLCAKQCQQAGPLFGLELTPCCPPHMGCAHACAGEQVWGSAPVSRVPTCGRAGGQGVRRGGCVDGKVSGTRLVGLHAHLAAGTGEDGDCTRIRQRTACPGTWLLPFDPALLPCCPAGAIAGGLLDDSQHQAPSTSSTKHQAG